MVTTRCSKGNRRPLIMVSVSPRLILLSVNLGLLYGVSVHDPAQPMRHLPTARTAWTTFATHGVSKHQIARRAKHHCGLRAFASSYRGTSESRERSRGVGTRWCRDRHTLWPHAAMMEMDPSCADNGYVVDPVVGKCGLEPLPALKNMYFALRHGQSVANMEGIISSDPEVGAVSHGLTSHGRAQARAAATALIDKIGRDKLDSLVFVSSDFLRARQTAEECRAALVKIIELEREAITSANRLLSEGIDGREEVGNFAELEGAGVYDVCPPVVIRQELRERSFGQLDGTILVNYNKVWPEDLKNGKQECYGVESVCDVAARIGTLVRSLELEYEDACIVFSSHADTLQICQCHIAGADERLFSQYRFKNGEVRRLLQYPSSLPPPNPLSFN